MKDLVIGVDYGTDSCRAVVVNCTTCEEISSYTEYYPRWRKGFYCDPSINQYRQHPQDYIDSLIGVIKGAMGQLPKDMANDVVAIGIDTTGSTPCLTDENGMPLALLPEFAEDPDAMFILWKDHTSIKEAEEINALSKEWETDYTMYSGGVYSSEWFWAKALHVLRVNEKVRTHAYSIIEHCDWMPALLTGKCKPNIVQRSRCAAGHKGMWCDVWSGYPSQEFFSRLDPLFNGFRDRISNKTYTSDNSIGYLTKEWADKLGLTEDVAVAVGIIDAHAGAIGAGIKDGTMVKIIGTSTCDIVVSSKERINDKLIPGISGQVDGSVIPDLIGLEAGQSAFGDIYAWFKDFLLWTVGNDKSSYKNILDRLTEEAQNIPVTDNDIIASDWLNGRRTPFADQSLKGGISGITLSTSPAMIYKSLVEATAFGSRAILEHLNKENVKIEEVIGVGGISLKSPYVMQTLSNVMGVPIKVARAQQSGALGVAMCASVAAGMFGSLEEAQTKLGQGVLSEYMPDESLSDVYEKLYHRYKEFGNYLEEEYKRR